MKRHSLILGLILSVATSVYASERTNVEIGYLDDHSLVGYQYWSGFTASIPQVDGQSDVRIDLDEIAVKSLGRDRVQEINKTDEGRLTLLRAKYIATDLAFNALNCIDRGTKDYDGKTQCSGGPAEELRDSAHKFVDDESVRPMAPVLIGRFNASTILKGDDSAIYMQTDRLLKSVKVREFWCDREGFLVFTSVKCTIIRE